MEICKELTSGKKSPFKWLASFLVKSDLISDIPKTGLSVGVDVDIKSFLALSSG
jgi:putative transposase